MLPNTKCVFFDLMLYIWKFSFFYFQKYETCILGRLETSSQPEFINPCIPSPCGPYSQCRDIGSSPSCSRLPTYVGTSPNCRPECTINVQCPRIHVHVQQGNAKIHVLVHVALMLDAMCFYVKCHVFPHVPVCNCPHYKLLYKTSSPWVVNMYYIYPKIKNF